MMLMRMTAVIFLLVVLAEVSHVLPMLEHPHRVAHVGPPKPPTDYVPHHAVTHPATQMF